MPANVFLTLTPSATVLSVDDGIGSTGRTEVGFGTRLAPGKEWWVSDHHLGINRDRAAAAPT